MIHKQATGESNGRFDTQAINRRIQRSVRYQQPYGTVVRYGTNFKITACTSIAEPFEKYERTSTACTSIAESLVATVTATATGNSNRYGNSGRYQQPYRNNKRSSEHSGKTIDGTCRQKKEKRGSSNKRSSGRYGYGRNGRYGLRKQRIADATDCGSNGRY